MINLSVNNQSLRLPTLGGNDTADVPRTDEQSADSESTTRFVDLSNTPERLTETGTEPATALDFVEPEPAVQPSESNSLDRQINSLNQQRNEVSGQQQALEEQNQEIEQQIRNLENQERQLDQRIQQLKQSQSLGQFVDLNI